VVVSLGAASAGEIQRLAAPCSISVLVREPDTVEFRVRVATLKLTDEALMPFPDSRGELRGAWLRVLPIAEWIVRNLQDIELLEAPPLDRWWEWCAASARWQHLTPTDAANVVTRPDCRAGDTVVLLRGAAEPLRRLVAASADATADRADAVWETRKSPE
jgi:hypothetical protein